MDSIQVEMINLTQRRLDGVHDTLKRVPYRSWAYNYWTGVYAYLLRRLNVMTNDNNLREQNNHSLH